VSKILLGVDNRITGCPFLLLNGVSMLIIGAIFVVFGGVVLATGIGTANLMYIVVGLAAAGVGFYAGKPRRR